MNKAIKNDLINHIKNNVGELISYINVLITAAFVSTAVSVALYYVIIGIILA